MSSSPDQTHEFQKKILRETAILVFIWVVITGIGSFLFFRETVEVIAAWIRPLCSYASGSIPPPVTTAIQNISCYLTNLLAYGTYVIIAALLVTSILFWLSLRQILKTNCTAMYSSSKDGEIDET